MISEHQAVEVGSDVDIINARIMVRQAARRLGMKLIDQSRISLATSSLADSVGLGTGRSTGEIVIDSVHRRTDGCLGLQVICSYHAINSPDVFQPSVANVRWMVDECNIREVDANHVQVTLIKWLS